MAIVEQFTCDICRKPKGDVNHWWMYMPNVNFVIRAWVAGDAESYKHACGQECLTQAVNRWMGENSK